VFDDRYENCGPFDDNWQELCIAAVLRELAAFHGDPESFGAVRPELLERLAAELEATLLQQLPAPAPVVVPVPVSERLPQSEDCDGEGRCWWFSPPACGPHKIRPCWTFDSETVEGDTHWLPHWALPLSAAQPEAEGPTDDELREFIETLRNQWIRTVTSGGKDPDSDDFDRAIARAVLAHWGRPTPAPTSQP
jgi:hypothetical protein